MTKIYKSILSLALLFAGVKGSAQVSAYSFTQLSGVYNAIPISGPTTTAIAVGNQDDNVYTNIPIGFNFNFNGSSYTSIDLCVNGWISMGSPTPPFNSYNPISAAGQPTNVIAFWARDLQMGPGQTCTVTSGSNIIALAYPAAAANNFAVGDTISGTGIPLNATVSAISAGNLVISAPATANGNLILPRGSISYQVSGVAPNQVFTVQWRRTGRYWNQSTGVDDYYNVQIKLYQTTDVIEIVYGTCGTNNAFLSTGEIGLKGLTNADFNNRAIATGGSYASSTAGSVNSATAAFDATTTPSNGQIYRWTPPLACTGAPSAGVVSPSQSICPNTTAVVSNTSSNSFTGITYQWMQAPAIAGPWTNVTTGSGFNTQVLTTTSLTSLTYYRLVITCTNSAQSVTTTVTSVNPNNPATLCYCNTSLGGSGCTGDNITNVSILGTPLNNNSTCNSNVTNGTYTQFPPGPNTTATLNIGITYSISVNTTASNIESVWIDYNQSGTFDINEHTQITLSSTANVPTIATFTVPGTALLGQTGMRVRSRGTGNPNGPTDPCTNFGSGETEDYIVTIGAATACSGTPGANSAVASLTTVCPNGTVTLGLATSYTVGGLTYQWSSASALAGPYTAIAGATTAVYTSTNVASTTFYRCVITCTNGPASTTATPVQVVVSGNPCQCSGYCLTSAPSQTADDEIFNVTIGTLNNTSNCSQTGSAPTSTLSKYSNYTGIVGAPNLIAGSNYTLDVTVGQCNLNAYSGGVTVYMDFNNNGQFTDPGEQVYASASTLWAVAGTLNSTVITIPPTANPGITRMRVIAAESVTGAAPCASYGYGETEDYCINIVAAAACSGAPGANTSVATTTNVCPNASTNLGLATSYTVGGLTYQWFSAPALSGPYTAISGATTSAYTATNIATTTFYQCVITCTNGPASTTATPVQVQVGGSPCQCGGYCLTSAPTQTADDEIFNVTIGTLNNTSNCSQTGSAPTSTLSMYSNYTGIVAAPNLAQNTTYTLDVTVGQCNTTPYSGGVTVYMDFNQNGLFSDPGEQVYASPSTLWAVAGTLNSTVITIPASASLGITRMRVIAAESNVGILECASYGYGETEDYCINITGACATPTVVLSASQTTICNGASVNLTASGATTYTWNTTAQTSSISVTPSVTTTYTVVGENAPGCPDTKTISITVKPSPTLSVSVAPSATLCPGMTATLTGVSSAGNYTWAPGSQTTAAISVTPAISTVYNVVTTNTAGCSTNSNVTVFVVVCTGVAKSTVIDNNTFIYPNPNSGSINVVIENSNGSYVFEVHDLSGRVVYKTTLNKSESAVNIKELANGMYTYKITSLTTKVAIKEGKLIKE
ncbi:MAG: T9SS type A sorting domain-containing protein [Bacteroidia bacterium]|nr:T9SS type A sorting domain-containing protein [Bacteroidia bacterium]